MIKQGTASYITHVKILDSSSTTGAGLTGLLFDSAGLTAYYIRPGDAAAIAISLITATLGAFTSGGFKEVSSANMPGLYELHVPDACLASGSHQVTITLKGAANMVPIDLTLDLSAVDPMVASFGLTLAKTTNITGFNDIAATAVVSNGAITTSSGAVSTVTTLTNLPAITAGWLTAAGIAVDAITAAKIAADAVTKIQLGLSTLAAGAAMTLESGERTAIANEVEAQIIDETDSEKVLLAITNKIASVNPDLSGLTLLAIASAVRTNLSVELARIDLAISTRMATFGYTLAPTANQNADALLDRTDGVETSVTPRGMFRALLAALAGVATGGNTTTIVLKNPAGDTTRVTLTVDADGNRSASVLNV